MEFYQGMKETDSFNNQNGCCNSCQKKFFVSVNNISDYYFSYIIPERHGGDETNQNNWQILCGSCHMKHESCLLDKDKTIETIKLLRENISTQKIIQKSAESMDKSAKETGKHAKHTKWWAIGSGAVMVVLTVFIAWLTWQIYQQNSPKPTPYDLLQKIERMDIEEYLRTTPLDKQLLM